MNVATTQEFDPEHPDPEHPDPEHPDFMRILHEGAQTHHEFSDRATKVNRIARLVVKPVLRWAPLNDGVLNKLQSYDRPVAPAPDIVTVDSEFGGVPGQMFWPRGGPRSSSTYLYFHGGGFFAGSVNSYRRLLEQISRESGARVVSVDYRQLPEVHLADTVSDAIRTYESVLEMVDQPDQIVVGGDSAGGYLTFKVAELARRRGLPDPAALIGFSPLLSLDPANERKAAQRAVRVRDAYLPPARVAQIRKRWLPEGAVIEGFADPFNAVSYISSPTFLLATEDEMLRPEAEAFASRLVARDLDVELHVWRKQVHAFPLLVNYVPEARVAVADAVAFAERQIHGEHWNLRDSQA